MKQTTEIRQKLLKGFWEIKIIEGKKIYLCTKIIYWAENSLWWWSHCFFSCVKLPYWVVTSFSVSRTFNRKELHSNNEYRIFRWEFLWGIGSNQRSKAEIIQLVESLNEISPLDLCISTLQVIFIQDINFKIWKLFSERFVNDIIERCKFEKFWINWAQQVEVKF